jgi:lysophospholipase L1-like esterase
MSSTQLDTMMKNLFQWAGPGSMRQGRQVASIAVLVLLAAIPLLAMQTENPPTGEPSNSKEAQEKKAAQDAETDGKYQAWKATRSADEQAWIKVLEENLGPFYLPLYKNEKAQGRISAWDFVEDDPALPRVLLIGDSISRSYTLNTRKALAGKANVHRAPENCGNTSNGLKKLDVWLGAGRWDLIHFNFGIHDRKFSDFDYRTNLQALVDRLKTTGAKLVWATTTPTPDAENEQKFSPERCLELNVIAKEVMDQNHIVIDDLFQVVQPRLAELQKPKDVHFKPEGGEVLGQAVAQAILGALPSKSP